MVCMADGRLGHRGNRLLRMAAAISVGRLRARQRQRPRDVCLPSSPRPCMSTAAVLSFTETMAGCSACPPTLSVALDFVMKPGASAATGLLAVLADAAAAAGSHGSGRKRSLKSCTHTGASCQPGVLRNCSQDRCCDEREKLAKRTDMQWLLQTLTAAQMRDS